MICSICKTNNMYCLDKKKETYFCTYCNKDYYIITMSEDDGSKKSEWQITEEQKEHILKNFVGKGSGKEND